MHQLLEVRLRQYSLSVQLVHSTKYDHCCLSIPPVSHIPNPNNISIHAKHCFKLQWQATGCGLFQSINYSIWKSPFQQRESFFSPWTQALAQRVPLCYLLHLNPLASKSARLAHQMVLLPSPHPHSFIYYYVTLISSGKQWPSNCFNVLSVRVCSPTWLLTLSYCWTHHPVGITRVWRPWTALVQQALSTFLEPDFDLCGIMGKWETP